jgi:hypothetical protein
LSQCKPESVFERDITSEIGREFELPKTCTISYCRGVAGHGKHTAMATTKFFALGLNLQTRDIMSAVAYDMIN